MGRVDSSLSIPQVAYLVLAGRADQVPKGFLGFLAPLAGQEVMESLVC